MATAEPATESLGPRYAPDDPSLPTPWKGLIDGSTGLLYYWNPETNITQYEKPTALPPPLPSGPPPGASTPKLAPIPGARTMQPNGVAVSQTPQHQGQQITSASQQHAAQPLPQNGQQHSSQLAQAGQQQGPQLGPMMQQQVQLKPQQLGPQMMQQPGQQQSVQQMQHMGQPLYQASHMGQSQGHQYSHQQMPYMTYQQTILPQGQQSSQQQTQHITQGQHLPHQQEHKSGFMHREDVDFQQGKPIGFSPSQIQQTGVSSVHNVPAGTNSSQMPQIVQPNQAQQFGSSSVNMQQPASSVPLQQSGGDLGHQQHGPRFPNPMGSAMYNPHAPPVGLKMGYEEIPTGRSTNDYFFTANKDGSTIVPQQPKLAALPMARNQQEMRMTGVPLPNVTPGIAGGLNAVTGQAMHNLYGHATSGPDFPNNSLMRQPPSMTGGSSDAINLSPTEVYRQQHEVTATGDDVPAPFMTFEVTGFPPEILREIHFAGFSSPTPIQAQTWPIALQGRDVVAIAKIGSGKTLGYLLPVFILLRQRRNNPQNGPTVIVLAPTRELATQIQDEAIKFGKSFRVSCTCLYGGAPKGPQLKELDRGADLVVATPGRLNDILEMKKIEFGQVSLLVLDEADRMLDMGFEPQIRK